MSIIIIQVVACDDPESDLIRWFGHGLGFSHVDSVLPDGTLLGARQNGGVAIRPSDYETFAKRLVIELPAPQSTVDAYYAFLHAQLGKPYDMEAIAGFFAGRNWRAPDSWFCSELAAAGLEQCGFLPFPLATPANKVTPDDIVLISSAFVKLGA